GWSAGMAPACQDQSRYPATGRFRSAGRWPVGLLGVDAGEQLPGLLTADAVRGQRVVLLERLHRGLGAGAEVAVDGAVVEAEVGRPGLQVAAVVAAVAVPARAADAAVLPPLVVDVAPGLERVVLLRQPAVLVVRAVLVDTLGGGRAGAVEAVVPGQRLVGGTV